MKPTKTQAEKLGLFLTIFFPILIYQFANYSANVIDTMMTGQYGTTDLAGVSMATSLWSPFFALLTGIVSALVPIIGQHLGRGETKHIREEFHQFVYLSFCLMLILFLLVWFGSVPVLEQLDLEVPVQEIAQSYLRYLAIGIFPLMLFSVCRSFFDAIGLTRLSMYLMLLLVPFNSFFNYVLIYGRFGMVAMGGSGAGLGTALAYWALLLVMLLVMAYHPRIAAYRLWQFQAPNLSLLKEALRLGLPIGLQIFAEVAIFAVVGLAMSSFSSQVIAAHQAAMNFTTLLYAFPLSVSMTLAILISYEVGAKRYRDVAAYRSLGRWVAMGFAVVTLSFLFLFREQVVSLYGSNPNFMKLTAHFLAYALFFQLADAFTAPIQGILRGYKDTTIPFFIGVLSYWGVTFPLAFLLETRFQLGPVSYWIGLISGIMTCGLLLQLRLGHVARRLENGE